MAEQREQAYATARGIATEQAIAEVVEAMAQRSTAPAVAPLAATDAIARREDLLGGHRLTAGRHPPDQGHGPNAEVAAAHR